jgi:hypothetical protein
MNLQAERIRADARHDRERTVSQCAAWRSLWIRLLVKERKEIHQRGKISGDVKQKRIEGSRPAVEDKGE